MRKFLKFIRNFLVDSFSEIHWNILVFTKKKTGSLVRPTCIQPQVCSNLGTFYQCTAVLVAGQKA